MARSPTDPIAEYSFAESVHGDARPRYLLQRVRLPSGTREILARFATQDAAARALATLSPKSDAERFEVIALRSTARARL